MIQAFYIPYLTVKFDTTPETAKAGDLTIYQHQAFILYSPENFEACYFLKRNDDLSKSSFNEMYVAIPYDFEMDAASPIRSIPDAELLRKINPLYTQSRFEEKYNIWLSDEALAKINEELSKLPEEKGVELSDKVLEWAKALHLSKNPPAEVQNLFFR